MNRRMIAKPTTRRDAVDAVRLKAAGHPSHINAREEALLRREMPQAAGPVITRGLLAEAGVRGDDRVTNLIPAEAKLLKRHGGSGDRNPITGLLQYGDGMGGSDNPGGGHDASASGAPGGGYGGGYGPGPSSGPSGGGYYGGDVNTKPDIANMSLSDLQDQFSQHSGSFIDSLLSMPNNYRDPGYKDLPGAFQFSPPDTFGRLRDTYLHGPPPSYTARGKLPGPHDAPTGLGPGFARKAVSTLAGPAGGPISGLMSLGVHMDQAMSPESRAASLSANQAQGSKNSTGRDNSGFSDNAPGTASGSVAAAQQVAQQIAQQGADTTTAPGYVITPDGRISHAGKKPHGTLSGLPQPVQNILIDYLWRGQGGGLLG
jgi:hypothetical protein